MYKTRRYENKQSAVIIQYQILKGNLDEKQVIEAELIWQILPLGTMGTSAVCILVKVSYRQNAELSLDVRRDFDGMTAYIWLLSKTSLALPNRLFMIINNSLLESHLQADLVHTTRYPKFSAKIIIWGVFNQWIQSYVPVPYFFV